MAKHWGLDLVTLELIATVAEQGSISRAAKITHLALAAASHRITEFERHFDVRVFERQARGVRVTPAGQAVLNRIQLVLTGINSLSDMIKDIRNGVTDHLRLLANSSVIAEFLPQLLARFIVEHPHVQVEVEELSSTEIVRAVVERHGSIGALWSDVDTRGLASVLFGEDELVLVVPHEHPLGRRRAVQFADTLDFDYVMFEPTSPLYIWLRREASRLNATLKGRIQVRGFDAMCRMVAAGLGIGVVPRRAAAGFAKSMRIVQVDLLEPWVNRKFCIVYRNAGELAPVESEFLAFVEAEWSRRSQTRLVRGGRRAQSGRIG